MIGIRAQFKRGEFSLDVELEVGGHVTGLFGPSGSGKSTLIHLIAGLDHPDRGVIEVDGRTLFHAGRRINVPTHKRGVGVVFQEPRLFPHLLVHGNLLYGQSRPQASGAHDEFRQITDMLELGGLLRRRVSQLSGGERQRVALGRALISRPTCLLLDEPLASLDQRLKQQIIPYLQRVRDESATPLIYVSHDLGEILQLTDQLVVMEKGGIVAQGCYTDLVHNTAAIGVMHDRGIRNLLAANVIRHEPGDGVSILQLGSGRDPSRQLIIPLCAGPLNSRLTVSVQPWDIALASEVVHGVSIQNQIRGTVGRCTLHEKSAWVEVDIGVPVIVEVSRRSAVALELAPGRPIVCLIKSHVIRPMQCG